ncbi:MAG: hypothetical protein R3F60_19515 [bacterium]
MRKVLLVVVILAVAAAAGWWFFLRGGGGQPPALAARLEAGSTVGFVAIEQPVALIGSLASRVEKVRQALPPEAAALADPAVLTTQAGFDPRTAEGWQSIGLDPAAGLGLVRDARVGELPIVLARVSDQGKLLAWAEKVAGVMPTITEGKPSTLAIGDRQYLFGNKGEMTAFVPFDEAARAGFQAFLDGNGPSLAEVGTFQQGFDAAKAGPRATLWVDTTRLVPPGEGDVAKTARFYSELYPGWALFAGPGESGMRFVATEKGVEALRQTLEPPGSAPTFSAFVPAEGWFAVRASVNIKELFTGVQALLPPTVPAEARSQMGMAKLGFAMVAGFAWDELAEGFGGHVVAAGATPRAGVPPEWLVLASASSKADKLLDSLAGRMESMAAGMGAEGPKLEKKTLGGVSARTLAVPPFNVVLARVDDVMILASSPEVFEAAVKRSQGGASLKGTLAAGALDGDVVAGLVISTAGLVAQLETQGKGPAVVVLKAAELGPHLSLRLALDRHGLTLGGDLVPMLSLVGAGALFGMPVEGLGGPARRERDEATRRAIEEAQEAQDDAPEEGGAPDGE